MSKFVTETHSGCSILRIVVSDILYKKYMLFNFIVYDAICLKNMFVNISLPVNVSIK